MREVVLSSLITIIGMSVLFRLYVKDLESEVEYMTDLFHATQDLWLKEYERVENLEKALQKQQGKWVP